MKNFISEGSLTFQNLCYLGALQVLVRMGLTQHNASNLSDMRKSMGILDQYDRLFIELVESLLENEFIAIRDGYVETTDLSAEGLLNFELSRLIGRSKELNQQYQAHLALTEVCLSAFADVLTGKLLATDIMFPKGDIGLVSGIYKQNDEVDIFNSGVTSLVRSAVEQNISHLQKGDRFTILEVGAGTGGTSSLLFEALYDYREYLRYIYTDLSKSFLIHAKNTYQSVAPYLETQIFDIESSATDQGFKQYSCDMVIGANVVHATQNIAATLNCIKPVLKKNGILLLNELASTEIFTTITFGLLPGWWLYEDNELRLKGSPGLSGENWKKVLNLCGFVNTQVYKDDSIGSQHLILAQSDGLIPETKQAQKPIKDIETRPVRNDGGTDDFDLIGTLKSILAATIDIPIDEINEHEPFSDLGVDSISSGRLIEGINQEFGIELTQTQVFDYPNITKLAKLINEAYADIIAARAANADSAEETDIENTSAGNKGTENTSGITEEEVIDKVTRILSETINIPIEEFSSSERFSDLGVDSILGGQFVNNINEYFGIEVSPTLIFDYSNTANLARYIISSFDLGSFSNKSDESSPVYKENTDQANNDEGIGLPAERDKGVDIAIVGMSGKYSGVENLDEFWLALKESRNLIEEIPASRWSIEEHYSADKEDGKSHTKWGGFLKDIDKFDPEFFRISGREAENMDPQHRLFLEECWKALEDAAIAPSQLNESNCGVYVGCGAGDYIQSAEHRDVSAFWGGSSSILAARVSYFLNLKGPAVAIDTACSSSLTALYSACNSLMLGESDIAISGAVSIQATPAFYKVSSKAGMLSPNGQCYAFDHRANGFVPGEGVGVVILKRLQDAEADGDQIYGVIRGMGTNQDGASNGITAPSAKSQQDLETSIYQKYDIDPNSIDYVEAHGTGTSLGDPIEFEALKASFVESVRQNNSCALGSVKTNVGHTLHAAGMAGLHKILLSIKHGQIPPSINYEKSNPLIDIENSPFFVNTELQQWPVLGSKPKRAAISSFGFSGTNAHFVIDEYSKVNRSSYQPNQPAVIILSALNIDRLKDMAENLKGFIESNMQLSIYDIAYTLQVGRSTLDEKVVFLANTNSELISQLSDYVKTNQEPQKGGGVTESARPLEDLYRARDMASLSEYWLRGSYIDWDQAYEQNNRPQKISLPGYPFARETYWIALESNHATALSVPVNHLHPILHQNTSNLAEQKFTSVFTGDEYFLTDHIVRGKKILPGVAYLEMARAAGVHSADLQNPSITDIVWATPVEVGAVNKEVSIKLEPGSEKVLSEKVLYEVYSMDGNDRVLHCKGALTDHSAEQKNSYNIDELQSRFKRSESGEYCYSIFEQLGFNYGANFKGLKRIWFDSSAALSQVSVENPEGFAMPCGIWDCAIQTCVGLFIDSSDRHLYVPYSLKALNVFAEIPNQVWCYARKTSSVDSRLVHYEIDILDNAGVIVASFADFVALPMTEENSGEGSDKTTQISLYQEQWDAVDPSQVANTLKDNLILIAATDQQLIEKLEQSLNASVVSVSGENEAEYFIDIMKVIQPKMTEKQGTNITVVYQNDNYHRHAFVSGLLSTACLENPKLAAKAVGVDELSIEAFADLSRILDKETNCPGSNVRYKNSIREEKRWLKYLPEQSQACELQDSGVYLITGGLGGVGKVIAADLAREHSIKIVLLGRSEATEQQKSYLADLPNVTYIACDVTDQQSVFNLVENLKFTFGSIKGIIHSAGINKDEFIVNKPLSDVERVLSVKIDGIRNLDEATKDEPMDFLIMFSSLSAITGNIGQSDYASANVWMDNFATYRQELRNRGLRHGKTLSINWPYWADGGMQIDDAFVTRLKDEYGLVPMPSSEGSNVFVQLMKFAQGQKAVAYGDAERLDKTFLNQTGTSYKPHLIEAVEADEISDFDQSAVQFITEVIAEVLKFPVDKIKPEDSFDKYGIDSTLIVTMIGELEKTFGSLPKTLFFEYQSILELAAYFIAEHKNTLVRVLVPAEVSLGKTGDKTIDLDLGKPVTANRFRVTHEEARQETRSKSRDIAIIGISGKYPEADNIDDLWSALKQGRDCTSEISRQGWNLDDLYSEDAKNKGSIYVKRGGFINGVDKFDPLFFNISPKEAELLDPQERLFLESAWATVEDAGYTPDSLGAKSRYKGKVGVYVGVMYEDYQLYAPEEWSKGNRITLTASQGSIANRVSYFFNFNGPSMAIDTMCSSSLTAIHLACESIHSGQCKMALAGGVSLTLHPNKYLLLCERKFMSKNALCESFGVGDGYVPGEGVGSVLLKPLDEAIKDGDVIHGVIKGSALNHGGKTSGYSVPNPNAQADVVREALIQSDVQPEDISYIEAHGTGTALGDPIEIAGLNKVFDKRDHRCAIGSIKSNLGHCEAAAGMSSLTKVILQFRHRKLAPSIHSSALNPNIDFNETPFEVQQEYSDWLPHNNRRLAGISGFGAGGSNAHLIVEEYKAETISEFVSSKPALVPLSAKTTDRLKEQANNLRRHIENTPELNLHDIAYTLQVGRVAMEERVILIVESTEALLSALKSFVDGDELDYQECRTRHDIEQQTDTKLGKPNDAETDTQTLINAWVAGEQLSWNVLYNDGLYPQKISLPSYAFARESYWVPFANNSTVSQIDNIEQLNGSGSGIYTHDFNVNGDEPFFVDHKVKGSAVMPGVMYFEIVGQCLEKNQLLLEGEPFSLGAIKWLRPYSPAGEQQQISVVYDSAASTFQCLVNDKDGGRKAVLTSGELVQTVGKPDKSDLNIIRDRCKVSVISGQDCYTKLETLGLDYGPTHRLIEEVYVGDGETIALIKSSAGDQLGNLQLDNLQIEPGLFDCAIQSGIAHTFNEDNRISSGFIPSELEQFNFYRKPSNEVWVVSRIADKDDIDRGLVKLDFEIFDASGELCASLTGLSCRMLEKQEVPVYPIVCASPAWTEKVDVKPNLQSNYDQQIVIAIGDKISTDQIDRSQRDLYVVSTRNSVQPEAFQEHAINLFSRIKELLIEQGNKKVFTQVLVHRSEPYNHALAGLIRTARMENPFFKAQLIELDETETVNESLLLLNQSQPEDICVSYCDGHRNVQSWEELDKAAVEVPWKDGGTYLITGGLGGLGILFAREMAKAAQNTTILLLGRSAITAEKQAVIEAINQNGTKVEYHQIDIENTIDLEQFVQNVLDQHLGIQGILHSAGLIQDNFIIKKSQSEIYDVLGPKVSGLINLDKATQNIELDFFILFSSITGAVGNVGQADYAMANAFMDVFSRSRNELVRKELRNGRTLSLNWPFWKDGGMQIGKQNEEAMFSLFGMVPLDTDSGMNALYRAFASERDQVLVAQGNPEQIKHFLNMENTHSQEESSELSEDEQLLRLIESVESGHMSENEFIDQILAG